MEYTLTEITTQLKALDTAGRTATLEHKTAYPVSSNGGVKKLKLKGKYHAPGTQSETCELCKTVINAFDAYKKYTTELFGFMVPYESLISAINVSKVIAVAMQNEAKKNE